MTKEYNLLLNGWEAYRAVRIQHKHHYLDMQKAELRSSPIVL